MEIKRNISKLSTYFNQSGLTNSLHIIQDSIMKGIRILIVDDEQDIIEFTGYNLRKEGFQVWTATSGTQAIGLAREIKPHLILLDVMMPDMDGIETCERIREIPELNNVIVAFLTARTEDYSQIAGFEAGGDDYIAKPVRPKLLISRISALLKRFKNEIAEEVKASEEEIIGRKVYGNLAIDTEGYTVTVDDVEVFLPKQEFRLLQVLTSRPSKVFTRAELFDTIWGNDSFVSDRTLDVYVRKIRSKIGDERIKTIKGVGYKFE
jgi:two-component system, OmpR family, alkaline phosphatase synthesis response regulator PhoP